MSYKHKLVSKERKHAEAHSGDLTHSQELRNFRIRVHKDLRGVETFPRDTKSAWVCIKGEPMVLGWIGYGDYQTSKTGDPKYVVYARDVANMKYSDYTDQYYMRMAVSIDTAVKHAKRFMRTTLLERMLVFKTLATVAMRIKGLWLNCSTWFMQGIRSWMLN